MRQIRVHRVDPPEVARRKLGHDVIGVVKSSARGAGCIEDMLREPILAESLKKRLSIPPIIFPSHKVALPTAPRQKSSAAHQNFNPPTIDHYCAN